jgi:hypothetical protein
MRAKLRQLLTKFVEVSQARGWTAPDARLVARIEALERRLTSLEARSVPPPASPAPARPVQP